MKEIKIYSKAREISQYLIQLFQNRSPKESEEFDSWLQENESAQTLLETLSDPEKFSLLIQEFNRPEKENEAQKLVKRINDYKKRRRIIQISSVAACILLVIFISINQYRSNRQSEVTIAYNQPTLILPNGQNISLAQTHKKDSLSTLHTPTIPLDVQKFLCTHDTCYPGNLQTSDYNTLIIPTQCNYSIILCDGTLVHLNASSQLKYPTQFGDKERKVYLTGEAYFEVTKTDKPFIVTANQVQIQVYGTKFNVNTYIPDQVTTVLVEGVVGISSLHHPSEEKILHPNQRSQINIRTGEQNITEVFVDKYISWTQGYLRYDNNTIGELIQDLQQWYGVEFEYTTSDLKEIRISASINKDLPLENILNLISNTTKIKFIKSERGYQINKR